jgi:hypothetical protein
MPRRQRCLGDRRGCPRPQRRLPSLAPYLAPCEESSADRPPLRYRQLLCLPWMPWWVVSSRQLGRPCCTACIVCRSLSPSSVSPCGSGHQRRALGRVARLGRRYADRLKSIQGDPHMLRPLPPSPGRSARRSARPGLPASFSLARCVRGVQDHQGGGARVLHQVGARGHVSLQFYRPQRWPHDICGSDCTSDKAPAGDVLSGSVPVLTGRYPRAEKLAPAPMLPGYLVIRVIRPPHGPH